MYDHTLLKQLRKANGLTQQQVADLLFLDRSTYTYYEGGHTKINIDIAIQLARLYRVSVSNLAGAQSAPEADAEAPGYGETESSFNFPQLSREERSLVILYRSGSAAQRRLLLEQAADVFI